MFVGRRFCAAMFLGLSLLIICSAFLVHRIYIIRELIIKELQPDIHSGLNIHWLWLGALIFSLSVVLISAVSIIVIGSASDDRVIYKALQESEQTLSILMSNLPGMAYRCKIDKKWTMLFVSEGSFNLTGYHSHDLVGNKRAAYGDLIHPDDREMVSAEVDKAVGMSKSFTFEYRIRTASGEEKWVWEKGCAILSEKGSEKLLEGFIIDITERRLISLALQNEREQLLSLFNSIEQVIYVADPNTYEILFVNEYLKALLGHNPIGGTCFREFQGFDKPCGFCSNDLIFGSKGKSYIWEYFNPRFQKYYLITDKSIRWPDGRDVRFEMAIDITDRRRAEEDLKRIEWMLSKRPLSMQSPEGELNSHNQEFVFSEDNSRLVIRSVGAGLLRTITSEYLDLLETVTAIYESDGHCVILGHASGWCRLLGKSAMESFNKRDTPESEACRTCICMKGWKKFRDEMIASGNHSVDLDCSCGLKLHMVPIVSGDEPVGYISCAYGDPPSSPAELKKIAKEFNVDEHDLMRASGSYNSKPPYIIEMLKNRLKGSAMLIGIMIDLKIAQEQRDKLEAQLLQVQKMEAVGRLAGGVAHDFNNMLSVIQGYAQLAQMKSADAGDIQKELEEIIKASRRSSNLTGQLLAFARRQPVKPVVVNLNEAVSAMLEILTRLIGEDIQLFWNPGDNLWNVRIDPIQVDQILTNLSANARDAIPGVGKVTIETANVSINDAYCTDHMGFMPGHYVLLAISDNGQGMDKETLEHLFEPFYTTKDITKGTGLGLATVYGIVRQNRGFANVYSELGNGSTFKIYLPRYTGSEEAEPVTSCTEENGVIIGGTETILLVEDEESILKLGMDILQGLGYQVIPANTPEDAIVKSTAFDGEIHLLITDVVMPQMNGRDLVEKLVLNRPGIKCIYMSGYTANVIAHHGVLDESVLFLQKPFTTEALGKIIRKALS